MARSLSWSTAAQIASRDMHSSRGKFFFVLLSVSIGVAALTGVRGFSSSFRSTLLLRARSIMAADISARMFQTPTPGQQKAIDDLESGGVQMTQVTEMLSMASSSSSPNPLLISLKAVDPAVYPFYGQVELSPAMPLSSALVSRSVAVGDDLLMRLHLHVGDPIKIGTQTFRISATVVNEPDRLSSSFAAGPRVLISRESLAAAGLLAPGNRATQRLLFKVPSPADGHAISDSAVAAFKSNLAALLPEAQLTDYRETNPSVTEALDRSTSLLSLMSLVALVLGAVGVAMAMRAHLQQRLDTIAIMKSLGAVSSQIMKIYLLQTLLLGVAGGIIGVICGLGVQLAFPLVLGKLINIPTEFHIQIRALAVGLGAGTLMTLLFTLPPLLDIRGVRPVLILRRSVAATEDPFITSVLKKISHNVAQIAAAVLILAGLSFIATSLSDSPDVGKWFAIGLAGVLVVLLAASWMLLRLLRLFLRRTRLQLPSVLRHGLANLYRPGNPSAALLAALGMGIMQIMMVFLIQMAVVNELHITTAPNLPNIFLVDIANPEIQGMRNLLQKQPGITAAPELLPVVTSRIEAIDGTPASQARLKNFPRRMLRSVELTWSDTLPPGTTLVDGSWWGPSETNPELAISQRAADRLGVKLGSTITFAALDSQFVAKVVAITKTNGQHAYSRAEFTLNHAALQGLPVIWYGGVHVDPRQVDQVQRALYQTYPTVTVINVAQALETVRAVVLQITYVVQFLAAFSIFAGAVILASSIAGTKYRRIREVVVLKTLGATRTRIASIFSIEFAVIGLVAGAVGIGFANLIVRILDIRVFHIAYRPFFLLNVVALMSTAALAVLTGWVASYRVLGQKPLEVLREE